MAAAAGQTPKAAAAPPPGSQPASQAPPGQPPHRQEAAAGPEGRRLEAKLDEVQAAMSVFAVRVAQLQALAQAGSDLAAAAIAASAKRMLRPLRQFDDLVTEEAATLGQEWTTAPIAMATAVLDAAIQSESDRRAADEDRRVNLEEDEPDWPGEEAGAAEEDREQPPPGDGEAQEEEEEEAEEEEERQASPAATRKQVNADPLGLAAPDAGQASGRAATGTKAKQVPRARGKSAAPAPPAEQAEAASARRELRSPTGRPGGPATAARRRSRSPRLAPPPLRQPQRPRGSAGQATDTGSRGSRQPAPRGRPALPAAPQRAVLRRAAAQALRAEPPRRPRQERAPGQGPNDPQWVQHSHYPGYKLFVGDLPPETDSRDAVHQQAARQS